MAMSASGDRLAVGHHQHRRLQRHDARDAAAVVVVAGAGEVGHLALAEHLHPVGVDVVEVTDQVGARAGFADGHFVEAALGSAQAGHPLPLQRIAVVFEKDVGADDGGLHAAAWADCQPEIRACRPTASR
jgi:threonine dehydrogenase-like Zn-dependent dehydrogenase